MPASRHAAAARPLSPANQARHTAAGVGLAAAETKQSDVHVDMTCAPRAAAVHAGVEARAAGIRPQRRPVRRADEGVGYLSMVESFRACTGLARALAAIGNF